MLITLELMMDVNYDPKWYAVCRPNGVMDVMLLPFRPSLDKSIVDPLKILVGPDLIVRPFDIVNRHIAYALMAILRQEEYAYILPRIRMIADKYLNCFNDETTRHALTTEINDYWMHCYKNNRPYDIETFTSTAAEATLMMWPSIESIMECKGEVFE